MTVRTLLIFALSAILLTTAQSDQGADQTDIYLNSICTSSDRDFKPCSRRMYDGCICYNNGTCLEGRVDKCLNCFSEDVFAVIHDQPCPKQHPYLCPANDTVRRIVPSLVRGQACVCMRTGECSKRSSPLSKSVACLNSNVLAVFPLKDCPARTLNKLPTEEVICQESDRDTGYACRGVPDKFACVTYADGSKAYVNVDPCTCQNREVIKYTVGKMCEW